MASAKWQECECGFVAEASSLRSLCEQRRIAKTRQSSQCHPDRGFELKQANRRQYDRNPTAPVVVVNGPLHQHEPTFSETMQIAQRRYAIDVTEYKESRSATAPLLRQAGALPKVIFGDATDRFALGI